jgi:hypothetical protein
MMKKKEKKGEWVENSDYHAIRTWSLKHCLTFLSLSEATQRKMPGNAPACDVKEEVGSRIRHLIDIVQPPSQDEINDADQHLIVDTTNLVLFLLGCCYPDFQVGPIQHSQSYASLQKAIDSLSTHTTQILFYLNSAGKLGPISPPSNNSPSSSATTSDHATSNGQNHSSIHESNKPHDKNYPPPVVELVTVNFVGIHEPNTTAFRSNSSNSSNIPNNHHNDWNPQTSMPFAFTPKLQQEQLRQTSYSDIETGWDLDTSISFLCMSETAQKLLPGSKTPCKVKRAVCKRLDLLIEQKAGERVHSKNSCISTVVTLFNISLAIVRSAWPGVSTILTVNAVTTETLLSTVSTGNLKTLHEQVRQVVDKIDDARRQHLNFLVRIYC